jgi:hypothetical protein
MKTIEELKAFCEGYLACLPDAARDGADHWVQWDEYDINLFGSYYSIRIEGDNALSVDVYPRDWHDQLPDALYTFDIKGESK